MDIRVTGRRRIDNGNRTIAAQKSGNGCNRTHGRRQTNALRRRCQKRIQTFETQRKMRAAFCACYRMYFIDDHRFNAAQRLSGAGGEHQIKRLRRGDQNIGRMTTQLRTLLRRRIAGADPNPNSHLWRAGFLPFFANPQQGNLQVALDIRTQGFYRGNIEDSGDFLFFVGGGGGVRCLAFTKQAIQGIEKRGKGFPRTGRGDHQRVLIRGGHGPRLRLHRRGMLKCRGKPVAGFR